MSNPQYCVAIRTLGTAGEKYRQTLLSLQQQTIPPNKILDILYPKKPSV